MLNQFESNIEIHICQILSFIHAFVLHANGYKVDVDIQKGIPELGFFSRYFGSQKGVQIMHKCR
jgi:hypothetical protein